MKNITVSVDDETYRVVQIRAARMGMSVSALTLGYLNSLAQEESDGVDMAFGFELRPRDLGEVIADFDSRGVGLDSRDNLSRAELYDEAISGSDAIR